MSDLVRWSQQFDRVTERFTLYTSIDSPKATGDGPIQVHAILRPTMTSRLDTAYVEYPATVDEVKKLRDQFGEFFKAFRDAGRYFPIESFKFRED